MKLLAFQILVLLALIWINDIHSFTELYNKGRVWKETERNIYALTSIEMDVQRFGDAVEESDIESGLRDEFKNRLSALSGRQHEVCYSEYIDFYNEVKAEFVSRMDLLRSRKDKCQWRISVDSSSKVRGDLEFIVVRDDTLNSIYSWGFLDGTQMSGKRIKLHPAKLDLLSELVVNKPTRNGDTLTFTKGIRYSR